MKLVVVAAILLALIGWCQGIQLNNRPIIGVMSQETYGRQTKYGYSYIAASYVKFLESAGARVVPVLLGQPPSYYTTLADSLNGLLFPGGGTSIVDSDFSRKGFLLFNAALKKNLRDNVYFPVWGTCLGFELLMYFCANQQVWLKSCAAQDMAAPLNLTTEQSRLIDSLSLTIRDSIQHENVTVNYHQWCLTPHNFTASGLNQTFKVVSTNRDTRGLEYISTVEAHNLPIYATAWHPEKNQFEFTHRTNHSHIPHSPQAIRVGQEFANFFVNEARRNSQTFPTEQMENSYLIYNYHSVYTGVNGSDFEQKYYFN
ncbi:GGH [Cordylochernes scorpioides]|uniref:folate gamma-glutamyl hydrolase n=1 Tax=Cordylochernes scorpioides TaxID=51811 RepID=A0ABY6LL66_9ARAC|nr:GGH [Cordylochernes scorpioides]